MAEFITYEKFKEEEKKHPNTAEFAKRLKDNFLSRDFIDLFIEHQELPDDEDKERIRKLLTDYNGYILRQIEFYRLGYIIEKAEGEPAR
jgi:hypothetical protein